MSYVIPITAIQYKTVNDIELEPELSLFVKSSDWSKVIQNLFFSFLYSNV